MSSKSKKADVPYPIQDWALAHFPAKERAIILDAKDESPKAVELRKLYEVWKAQTPKAETP